MDLIKIAKEAFATDVKREMEFSTGDTITVAYTAKGNFEDKKRIKRTKTTACRKRR